jgi:hypothetical protein
VALEAMQRKRAERYDRYVRPLDAKLNGGQMAQALRMLREITAQIAAGRGRPTRDMRSL